MKNYFSITVALSCILFLSLGLKAQERMNMEFGYSINQPTGAFRDAVKNTSFRGFTGGLTYNVTERIGIGLGVSYSDFYDKISRQVYQTPEGSLSAVISTSVQVLPVVAKVKYNVVTEGLVKPYIGLGAGMNLINYDRFYGEFASSKVAIKPAVTGEAGVRIPLGNAKRSGLNIGAHYNYLPFNFNGIKNLNSYGAHLGVFFPLR